MSAGAIFLRGAARSRLLVAGVLVAIFTTPFLFGFVLFGIVVAAQLRHHFQIATGAQPRSSSFPKLVATLSYGGAMVVMGAWVSFVDTTWASSSSHVQRPTKRAASPS